MKFIVHYGKRDWEDQVCIEGETIEEIRNECDAFFRDRGIDTETLDTLWSEKARW